MIPLEREVKSRLRSQLSDPYALITMERRTRQNGTWEEFGRLIVTRKRYWLTEPRLPTQLEFVSVLIRVCCWCVLESTGSSILTTSTPMALSWMDKRSTICACLTTGGIPGMPK